MKIIVLAGGYSLERHVSLTSGAMVARALRASGEEVALVDLYFDITEDFFTLSQEEIPPSYFTVDTSIPDLAELAKKKGENSHKIIGEGILSLCHQGDLVFLALHGASGEDGRLQALLDLEGIAYTGSGHLASGVAMDKHLTKCLIGDKIPTAPWKKLSLEPENLTKIVESTTLPVVVKPLNSGSSIGVSIVHHAADLRGALEACLPLGGQVILEEYLQGREIQVAILGDEALPAIEIIVEQGFYDMENKYKAGKATEICPADISPALAEKLSQYALEAFHSLGLSVLARADFIVTADEIPYFLEINTLPGMTPTSLLPQEAAALGMDYEQLCQRIVKLSLEK